MDFPYNTRLATSSAMRFTSVRNVRLQLTFRSFVPRACQEYDKLPTDIRQASSMNTFRSKLKDWVKNDVEP